MRLPAFAGFVAVTAFPLLLRGGEVTAEVAVAAQVASGVTASVEGAAACVDAFGSKPDDVVAGVVAGGTFVRVPPWTCADFGWEEMYASR